ncbi:MAG: SDR family NAD(P)-dependent oxidoreductase [Bacteroidetes bacterium]|nr:MAG: SDR family NAD(P)-dependent oxidoreductase [Bacteroidota bacterium]
MQVVITGVSGGIGKALAEFYLEKGNHVIGIGRHNAIDHDHFHFVTCDLRDLDAIKNLDLNLSDEPILLINNAGILGQVTRTVDQDIESLQEVFEVNVLAAMIMTGKMAERDNQLTIVNISSGAGKNPIPSWGAYCASKAALDMFSRVFFLEEQERGRNTKVYSIAPGVVDTNMQTVIRAVDEEKFSQKQRFVDLKEMGQLADAKEVARKIDRILSLPFNEEMIICSVRDLVD